MSFVSYLYPIKYQTPQYMLIKGFELYPERDLNPHSRNGHRILSPACLPFHHPGGIILLYFNQHSPACRTLSRFSGNSTIRAKYGAANL